MRMSRRRSIEEFWRRHGELPGFAARHLSTERCGGPAGAGRVPVMPLDVVSAADRWLAGERAMGSVVVVVAHPVRQGVVSGAAGAVALAAGPFAVHGLVEALDLAVPAWCVRAARGSRSSRADGSGSASRWTNER